MRNKKLAKMRQWMKIAEKSRHRHRDKIFYRKWYRLTCLWDIDNSKYVCVCPMNRTCVSALHSILKCLCIHKQTHLQTTTERQTYQRIFLSPRRLYLFILMCHIKFTNETKWIDLAGLILVWFDFAMKFTDSIRKMRVKRWKIEGRWKVQTKDIYTNQMV